MFLALEMRNAWMVFPTRLYAQGNAENLAMDGLFLANKQLCRVLKKY